MVTWNMAAWKTAFLYKTGGFQGGSTSQFPHVSPVYTHESTHTWHHPEFLLAPPGFFRLPPNERCCCLNATWGSIRGGIHGIAFQRAMCSMGRNTRLVRCSCGVRAKDPARRTSPSADPKTRHDTAHLNQTVRNCVMLANKKHYIYCRMPWSIHSHVLSKGSILRFFT